jgi:hypothetical protein
MGIQTGISNALKDHKQKISEPHFLMSAENPKHPEKNELKMDHPTVLAHLKGAGYDAHETQGSYDGKKEKSIAVYGVKPEHAEHLHGLAARLGQDSSIFSTGKKHEMRIHHGPEAGKKILGEGTTWHNQAPKDNFTTLPGGSHHFTHNFNQAGSAGGGIPENNKVKQVAEGYAQSKGLKLAPSNPVTVNPAHGAQIASAYEQMEHKPNDPKVKAAYGALIKETLEQFQHIKKSGLKISKMKPGQENPYKNSKDVINDIHKNNHLWYYPTEEGYGSEGSAPTDHPLLVTTGESHDGKPMLANDVFRVVHDYFGHAKEGHSFGPKGEHSAFLTHKPMYSPEAQKALASETMGQNNTVNFGKHGESNRKNPHKTVYAEQKAGLLPDEIINGKWHHAA